MPNRVTDMEIDEVGLVDRGANQRSDVLLYKRDATQERVLPEVIKLDDQDDDVEKRACPECGKRLDKNGTCRSCGYGMDDDGDEGDGYSKSEDESPADAFINMLEDPDFEASQLEEALVGRQQATMSKISNKMSSARADQLRAIHATLGRVLDTSDPADPDQGEEGSMRDDVAKGAPDRPVNLDLSVLDADVRAYVERLEKKSAPPPADLEDIYKGLEEARALVAKAQDAERVAKDEAKRHEEAVAKAQEEVAKARAAENLRECVAKASSWGNLPIAATDLGDMLHVFRDKAPEKAAKLEELLGRANGILKVEHAFEELGKTGSYQGSTPGYGPNSHVDVLAKELQSRDNNMSHAEAVSKALEEHPELYEQFLSDGRGR